MRRVADVMAVPVVVPASTSVQEGSGRMLDAATHVAVVVEDGRVVGLVTAELVAQALADGRDVSSTSVGAIALSDPPMLRPDEPLADAHRLMRVGGHPAVPVVGPDGRPVGVLEDDESAPV
jgi:CBS domain-containing protein